MNLIGEHTDYNDGYVMPFALAQRVTIAAGPRDDDRWRCYVTAPRRRRRASIEGDLQPGHARAGTMSRGSSGRRGKPVTGPSAQTSC